MSRLVFDQSSPVQPVSESRGGSTNLTEDERTEILVSNIGYILWLALRMRDGEEDAGVRLG